LNTEKDFDAIACVFTVPDIQKKRVMARPGMNKRYFDMILSKQFPAADKAGRSDYVIDTSTLETAQTAVNFIMKDIGRKLKNA
jgi:dephospho-CoA kinase